MWFPFATAFFLGWSLGANDAANIFGTAVSSRMIKFITAALLASIFVILGALLEGYEGIKTLGSLTTQDLKSASIITLSAAITVTIMTFLELPVSTSQAVVGAILGIGLLHSDINFSGLTKVVICWIGTPIGGFFVAIGVYLLLAKAYDSFNIDPLHHDIIIKSGLVIAGCYGSYTLGANNVANVVGVLVGAKLLSPFLAAFLGGISIAIGILTFSKGVMHTVGRGIVRLDGFSALIVVIAEAITVHIYTWVGVPVSTSQAVVGAVLGVGVLKRIEALKLRAVLNIFTGWLFTPLVSFFFSILIYVLLHLKYTG